MSKNRIINHPVLGNLDKKKEITFTFDGKKYKGLEGDTIASALLANGIRKLRVHEETGTPRSIYCNIGHCFECRVTLDGVDGVRACMTEVKDGMKVDSGKLQPAPLKSESQDDLPRTYSEFTDMQKANREED